MSDLSTERLREILAYDSETGVFTWRTKICHRTVVGRRAGYNISNGYREIGIFGVSYKEHRLAWLWMTGKWPQGDVDHRNGSRSDNRWSNLREATRSQNVANSKRGCGRSAPKGATFNKQRGRWVAQICCNNRKHYLGHFDTAEEAGEAYAVAARELFGEFAKVAAG
jgi:hypothetical protein